VWVPNVVDHQIKQRNQVEVLHNDEGVKDLVVIVTHTIIDPGAMVIKGVDTLVTVIAVPTSRGFQYLAIWAKQD
jgi:hypothetical protein